MVVRVYRVRLHTCARCNRYAISYPRHSHCCWQCRENILHHGEIVHTSECKRRQEGLEDLLFDYGELLQEGEPEMYKA